MKKSEIFYEAMRAVIRAGIHDEHETIEILNELQDQRKLAEWSEKQKEAQNQEGGVAE